MTKAIIFDFWGTLVEQGAWSPIKQVRNILRVNMPFSEYVVKFETVMMTRQFKDLREAFMEVAKEFSVGINERMLAELIGLWNKNWMLAQPYEETKRILTGLRQKYKLILISNTDSFSIEKVLEKHGLAEFFDVVYLSYKIGMIKTDKNFLLKVLSDNGLSAEECIVVGDSLQSDILPAKKAGIKAILVDRNDKREAELKIKNLDELEEKIKE